MPYDQSGQTPQTTELQVNIAIRARLILCSAMLTVKITNKRRKGTPSVDEPLLFSCRYVGKSPRPLELSSVRSTPMTDLTKSAMFANHAACRGVSLLTRPAPSRADARINAPPRHRHPSTHNSQLTTSYSQLTTQEKNERFPLYEASRPSAELCYRIIPPPPCHTNNIAVLFPRPKPVTLSLSGPFLLWVG